MTGQLPKSVIALAFTVLVLAGIGSYFAFRSENRERKNLTNNLPANITNTEVRRMADPETGQERSVDIIVSFEYEFNGRRYHRTVRKSKTEALAFVPWSRAKVCYDPGNPSTIEDPALFPIGHECGRSACAKI